MRRNLTFVCGLLLLLTVTSSILFLYSNDQVIYTVKSEINHNGILVNLSDKKMNTSEPNVDLTITMSNSVKCPGLNVTVHLESVDHWQSLNRDKHAFVFSAYLVYEIKKIVIIGMKIRYSSLHFCQLWYKNAKNQPTLSEEILAKLTLLPEGHGQPYSAVLFECSLDSSLKSLPSYVSLVTNNCTTPSNLLLIHHVSKPEVVMQNFTVCLPPLHDYSSVYELVEWIELNKILGAEKFIVYNYSSNVNVQHVLDFYSKKGITTIIQWQLPKERESNSVESKPVGVHYFGQVAALNDCLFRNKYNSEFIVNLDLDEFIIPHAENVTSWIEILETLKHDAPSYIFRNTFFKKEWDNAEIEIPNKTLADKYHLVTLQKVQHEKKIYTTGQRSKYLVRTSQVSRIMIHTASGVYNMPVPTDVALLHHYRDWGSKNDPAHVKVLDKTVPLKFGNELIENVRKVWSELNETIGK
ncbi:beta-1,4-galactosyltransferase galt-1-like [Mercenaria mercenaria]|uniref:beta-1,4-galactosyltransferase galt-1-like n=1 Tax=Mercenaria mercenaria TaxID=6596 RepID=UPI00234F267B|nr:beta-1,4-galactosyltransferase galt-1-like [Mercenaria mercenaria]XP_053383307.1 beta-1,4-galactosyltransferase galt-1-like [Mercenaria mercenaria]